MKSKVICLNKDRNVSLTVYLQETEGEFAFSKRPAVLILPGGGYAMCSDREADPVAMAYLKAGYQAFVLRYTVGKTVNWPDPLNDYEQAIELIKENAKEWGVSVEKIAVVGFSAGGHLAACAATMAKNRPTAAVLVYPAILTEIAGILSITEMPAPIDHIDNKTPPCFIAAARDDAVVAIKHSLTFQLALAEKGIGFEGHTYSFGGHGFSTAEDWVRVSSVSERVENWVDDSIGWLGEVMGRLTHNGFTDPNPASLGNGDIGETLSVVCTLSHIRKQGDDVKIILKPLFDGISVVAAARGYNEENLVKAIGNTTVRELLEVVGISEEKIADIDASLRQIRNKVG